MWKPEHRLSADRSDCLALDSFACNGARTRSATAKTFPVVQLAPARIEKSLA